MKTNASLSPATDTPEKTKQNNKPNSKKIKNGTSGQRPLSKQELEFIRLVCMDMSHKEIAGRMCVSVRTVDGYRDTTYEKLNIHSRAGLIMYAVKNNLAPL